MRFSGSLLLAAAMVWAAPSLASVKDICTTYAGKAYGPFEGSIKTGTCADIKRYIAKQERRNRYQQIPRQALSIFNVMRKDPQGWRSFKSKPGSLCRDVTADVVQCSVSTQLENGAHVIVDMTFGFENNELNEFVFETDIGAHFRRHADAANAKYNDDFIRMLVAATAFGVQKSLPPHTKVEPVGEKLQVFVRNPGQS